MGEAVTSAQAEASAATSDGEQHPPGAAGGHREVEGEGEEPGGTEPSARGPHIPKKIANSTNAFLCVIKMYNCKKS